MHAPSAMRGPRQIAGWDQRLVRRVGTSLRAFARIRGWFQHGCRAAGNNHVLLNPDLSHPPHPGTPSHTHTHTRTYTHAYAYTTHAQRFAHLPHDFHEPTRANPRPPHQRPEPHATRAMLHTTRATVLAACCAALAAAASTGTDPAVDELDRFGDAVTTTSTTTDAPHVDVLTKPGPGAPGPCRGNDSRCPRAGREECRALAADGADCAWEDAAGGGAARPGPRLCCTALTAECQACSQGVSVAEYCRASPGTHGCARCASDTVSRRQQDDLGALRREAEAIAATAAGVVADLKRLNTEERQMEALLRSLEKQVASAGC